MADKTLNNTNVSEAKSRVSDIEVFGDGDMWKCINKASSKKQDWMKSTKVLQMPNGIVLQVSTQQGKNVAESVCFIPNVTIGERKGKTVFKSF